MKGKDRYSIDAAQSLIDNYQDVIVTLYMPLIGTKASCLYLLMNKEKTMNALSSLDRLCTLTHMDIDKLEEKIHILEQYQLLRTFVKEDKYHFVLISPLSAADFFAHSLFSRMYLNALGQSEYEVSKAKYFRRELDHSDYQEVTHSFDMSVMKNWDANDESVYQTYKNLEQQDTVIIDFDYNLFFQKTSELKFPPSARTKENMVVIGKLATLYSIPVDDMEVYVAKSYDTKNGVLDINKLKSYCLRSDSVEIKNVENKYQLPPVAFLYTLQQVKVSSADKRILEDLQTVYKMNKEVINVLVETTLENTGNKFTRSYVEKVASTWVRQGVDTYEKAVEAAKNTLPTTRKPAPVKATFTSEEMEVQPQNLQELRKKMFSKG